MFISACHWIALLQTCDWIESLKRWWHDNMTPWDSVWWRLGDMRDIWYAETCHCHRLTSQFYFTSLITKKKYWCQCLEDYEVYIEMNLGFIWWNVFVTLITNLRLPITHMKLSMGPEHRPALMRINDGNDQWWVLQHFGHQYHPLTQTNNLLVTINSSDNFIIYCIFGNKFKRIFLSLLCGFIRGRPTQSNPNPCIFIK